MDVDTDKLLRIAQAKAARLAGKYGISREEAQDVGQDLLADLIARWPDFNPAKSTGGSFIRRVMENRLATMISARHAGCRDYRRNVSQGRHQGPLVSEQTDPRASIDSEIANLAIDIQRLRKRLRPDLAAVAVLLPSKKIQEITGLLGISRSTLYRRIRELRAVAIGLGLDRYFPGSTPRGGRR